MAKSTKKERNAQWMDKMLQQPNMVWLDLATEQKKDRLQHLLDLITTEYTVTIADVCERLLCGRYWVTDNVLPHVPHIFINQYTLAAMADYAAETGLRKASDSFPTGYYYFNTLAFNKWLHENTVADRQTVIYDLCRHTAEIDFKSSVQTLAIELKKERSVKKKFELREKLDDYIDSALDADGAALYKKRVTVLTGRSAKRIEMHSFKIPSKFTSAAVLRGTFNSNELIARRVYRNGCIRYTVAKSLVRYDAAEISRDIHAWEITLPAEAAVKA